MAELILTDSQYGSTARILPELGFNCFSLQVPVDGQLVEVLEAEADFAAGNKRGTRSGIPWLFPFPNRIEKGRYRWNGVDYQLPVSDAFGNAIHGFVMDRPWRVISADSQTAVAAFQLSVDAPERLVLWPSDYVLEVRYTLHQACLRADVRIANVGTQPLPWGLGTHPYFKTPLSPSSKQEQCLIQVPAGQSWELQDCLPSGQRLPVDSRTDLTRGKALEGMQLDDVLTGLDAREGSVTTAVIDPVAGLKMTQVTDALFRECVVFNPPGRACVCLEPYTCVTDAINLQERGVDAGLQVLDVGAEARTWFEIHVGKMDS